MRKKISIIGQCYNEEENIENFYKHIDDISKIMKECDFEIIFIDDKSKDGSLNIIKNIAKKDKRVKYASMSRNFGKDNCAMAGFKLASGDYVTTIDIDLQDPPELIPEMFKLVNGGEYDMVAAKATSRKGYSLIHKIFVKIFYGLYNKISTVKLVNGQRDYCLMNRKVVNAILKYKEHNLFIKGIWNDLGFNLKWLEFKNVEREKGETKWKFKRLLKYSINGIIDFSIFPLTFMLYFGLLLCFSSFILTVLAVIFKIMSVSCNYPILIISIITTLLFGINSIFLGIMSLYISQIHQEVKNRPLYIIQESNIKNAEIGDKDE